jgi:signal transduction histidine kinase
MDAAATGLHAPRALRSPWLAACAAVTLSVLVVVSAVGRWVLMGPVRRLPEMSGPLLPAEVVGPLFSVVLAGLGALVVVRGDSRRYGWLLLAMGASAGVIGFAAEYSVYAALAGVVLPFTTAAGWVQDLWMVTWWLGFLLLPALFPDGRVASSRWRRPVQLTAAAWAALIVVFMLAERPLTNAFLEIGDPPANPTGLFAVPDMAINVFWLVVTLASVVVGIGSVVTRWRTARGELRQQVKWVLYAFGVVLAVVTADLINRAMVSGTGVDLGLTWPISLLAALTMIGLSVALGLAVLRFRLYDVDLVINRTIVYGLLTATIVVTYVLVVVGVGSWLPVDDLLLSLVATGIVAVAFAPLRELLQRGVNRLMFGHRDDPYTVLSELGRLLSRSGAPDVALRTLAETVATTLKLPGVAIELEQDGAWQTRATHGEVPDADTRRVVVPLHHQGEVVGRLVVAPRSPREPLSTADRRLLEDIAHQAGALARTVRLTLALQRSREALVLTREEERRRIRRDLHDGLGPSLASQTFRLDAVLEQLQDGPTAAADLIAAVKQHNQQLVADIRRLVHELRPPALDNLGLAGALRAYAGQLARDSRLTIDLETAPDPLPTLPAAVEVAAYQIVREAITNVVRHAEATRCTATLQATGASMVIQVIDDGIGLQRATTTGVGLTSMRERAEELGGSFEVAPAHPTGAQVSATLPITTATSPYTNGLRTARRQIGAQHG